MRRDRRLSAQKHRQASQKKTETAGERRALRTAARFAANRSLPQSQGRGGREEEEGRSNEATFVMLLVMAQR